MEQTKSRSKSPAARILSLALALCMIAAFVPAFTLTAGAEDTDEIIVVNNTNYKIVGDNLISNGTFEEGLNGWYSVGSSNAIQSVGGAEQSSTKKHSGDYSWYQKTDGSGTSGNNMYGQFALDGGNGEAVEAGKQYVLSFWMYSDTRTQTTLTVGLASAENAVNNTNGFDATCGGTGYDGNTGSNVYELPTGTWYEMKYLLTANEYSKYAIVYIRWIGDTYLDDFTLYEVEEVSKEGEQVEVDGIPYEIVTGKNLASMGSFDGGYGLFSAEYAWTTAYGSALYTANSQTLTSGSTTYYLSDLYSLKNDSTHGLYLYVDGTKTTSSYSYKIYSSDQSGNGLYRYGTPMQYWDGAEAGKKYYVSFDVYIPKATGGAANYIAFGAYASVKNSSDYNNMTNLRTRTDTVATGMINCPTISTISDWETITTILDVTEDGYFGFQWEYILDYGYVGMDNFMIYEVERIPTTVTVKSVDASGNAVVGDKTINTADESLYAGDAYTYDTSSVGVITGDDTYTYVLDSEASTLSITALSTEASENVITLVYNQDTPVSVTEAITATTRVGIYPTTLPTTVSAIGENGNTISNLAVEWDTIPDTKYAQTGTFTVQGHLAAYESVKFTATVTVVDKSTYLLVSQSFDGENFAHVDGEDVGYIKTYGTMTATEGVSGNAAYFDGDDDNYITIVDASEGNTLLQNCGENLTISLFVNTTAGNWPIFITDSEEDEVCPSENYVAILQSSATSLAFERYHNGRNSNNSSSATYTPGTEAGKWYAVTLVIEGNYTSLYLNGEKLGTTKTAADSDISTMFTNASYIFLGRATWATSTGHESYTGAIDNLNIYSVALTEDEVADIAGVKTEKITYTYNDAEVYTEEVKGFEGQSVGLSSTFFGTDGARYDNSTSTHVIGSGDNTIAVTLNAATIKEIETISTSVIEGTVPVLPETVTVTYSDDVTVEANVTWGDVANLSEGDNTVTGTINLATTQTATANITVYPLTFTVADSKSYNDGSGLGNVQYLPATLSSVFVLEFDYTMVVASRNAHMQLAESNSSSNRFSGGAMTISSNGNTYVVNGGTGSGGDAVAGVLVESISAGDTMHTIMTIDPENYTYTATVTAVNGEYDGTTVSGGFRTNQSIAVMGFLTNGSGNTGDIEVTNIKFYAPNAGIEEYTVNYKGITRDSETIYTSDSTDLGYNGEKIFPNIEIPYEEGYIIKSKTVDTNEKTVTLTYEAVEEDAFFKGNADDTATVISLNMLGAHDAFTSNTSDKGDSAQIQLDGSTSTTALAASSGSSAKGASQTQTLDALGLLHAGVRYFDVRLSRSENTATAYVTTTVPSTNGVFYTTHALLSDEFRTIAYTISQWAAQHPYEVIILDFQALYDDGAANSTSWSDLADLLDEAGLTDYVVISESNASSTGAHPLMYSTIADVTANHTHAGVLLFAQTTGSSAESTTFIERRGGTDENIFSGRLYSNYSDCNNDTTYFTDYNIFTPAAIDDEFSADYIQAQVDYQNNYTSGNHSIYWQARVMQAQTELSVSQVILGSSTLLSLAEASNTKLYEALTELDDTDTYTYSTWLTALPIVMINGIDNVAGSDVQNLVTLLKEQNVAKGVTVNYVDTDTNTTIKSVEKEDLMVGTIYADETQYTILSGDDGKYYVTNAYSTSLSKCTSDIVRVPSRGAIEIPVTATGDIYTYVADSTQNRTAGTIYNDNLVENTSEGNTYTGFEAFGAYNWGGSGTYDRIGIAVINLPDKSEAGLDTAYDSAVNYVLKATQVRDYSTGSLNTNFYAIPYSTYLETDFSVGSNVTDLIAKATRLTYHSNDVNYNDVEEQTVEYTLDGLTAEDDTGKVVIIGCSTGGLYALTGMSIDTEINYGIDLIDGAQIRVGDGFDADKEDIISDSGLRFIAKVDTTNTLAGLADENTNGDPDIGIAIFDGKFATTAFNAETDAANYAGAEAIATIPAEKYQDGEAKKIFTAAITNIGEGNYNRVYIAVPYVVIKETKMYDWSEAIARTPYQVSQGLLVNGTEPAGYNYTADEETLINVLNVYTNQTGARITLTSDLTVGYVKYANGAEAFFTASGATDETTGDYVITLSTADSNAKFYSYADQTYRVNNARENFVNYYTTEDGTKATITVVDENTMTITIPAEFNTTNTSSDDDGSTETEEETESTGE